MPIVATGLAEHNMNKRGTSEVRMMTTKQPKNENKKTSSNINTDKTEADVSCSSNSDVKCFSVNVNHTSSDVKNISENSNSTSADFDCCSKDSASEFDTTVNETRGNTTDMANSEFTNFSPENRSVNTSSTSEDVRISSIPDTCEIVSICSADDDTSETVSICSDPLDIASEKVSRSPNFSEMDSNDGSLETDSDNNSEANADDDGAREVVCFDDRLGHRMIFSEPGGYVIRRKVFSFLPALDLLACCRVCEWFRIDAEAELTKRSRHHPQVTCHTACCEPTQLNSDVSRMWRSISNKLQQLWTPAAHVLVFITQRLRDHLREKDITDLSNCVPENCVITGGVSEDGICGMSNDHQEILTFDESKAAVTLVVLHDHCDLRLDSVIEYASRQMPRIDDPKRGPARDEFVISIGGTPDWIEENCFNRPFPYIPFFMGFWPSVDSFAIPGRQNYLLNDLQKPQYLRIKSRVPTRDGFLDVHLRDSYFYWEVRGIHSEAAAREMYTAYNTLKRTLPLEQQGLLALQTVIIYHSQAHSPQLFNQLITRCNDAFKATFPDLPLLSVLSRKDNPDPALGLSSMMSHLLTDNTDEGQNIWENVMDNEDDLDVQGHPVADENQGQRNEDDTDDETCSSDDDDYGRIRNDYDDDFYDDDGIRDGYDDYDMDTEGECCFDLHFMFFYKI